MKSTIKNMVLVLLAITAVGSAAVGYVYTLTKEPIEKAKQQKVTDAIRAVLPDFDNDPAAEKRVETVDGGEVTVYPATKGGNPVGYAVETFSAKPHNGFGGTVRLMVGLLPDGTIHAVEVISHSETPGLGDKMDKSKSDFPQQFAGKNPATYKLSVTKDGGDVDAITAATISSRAFCDAVARAYNVFQSVVK